MTDLLVREDAWVAANVSAATHDQLSDTNNDSQTAGQTKKSVLVSLCAACSSAGNIIGRKQFTFPPDVVNSNPRHPSQSLPGQRRTHLPSWTRGSSVRCI